MRTSQEDVNAEEAAVEEPAGTDTADIPAERSPEEVPAERSPEQVAADEAAAEALDAKRRSNIESEGMTEDGMAVEYESESVIRDSVADITHGFVNKAANILYSFIDVFVGISFVVMAFLTIFSNDDHGISYVDMGLTGWLSLISMLFGGSLLVLNPRRTFNTSIGLYAMVMGITTFCSNWESLTEAEDWGIFTFISDAIFIVQIVMLALSLNLIFSGYSYMRGRPRGTLGMMTKALLMLSFNVLLIVFNVYLGTYKGVLDALQQDPVTTVQIFLFFVFLNVMDTDEARSFNTKNRLSNSTEALRQTKTLDGKSYIYLKDALALDSATYEGWNRPRDGGPVEFEYRFAIHNQGGASYVTVQRWRGKDTYYLTISDHERGTNIRATRMSVDRMYMTEDQLNFRIVGRDHFYINMNVRYPLDEYDVGWRVKK